VKENWCFY